MRIALVAGLVAALALPSVAGFTEALDPVTVAVQARQETVDGSTRSGRRQYRALVAAEEHLTGTSTSVGDDLRALKRCARLLEKRFRGDEALMPVLDAAATDLEALTRADRDGLAELALTIDDKRAHIKLTKAVAVYDRKVEKAARASRASQRAGRIRAGWRALAKVERKLGLGRLPDFSLADANPSSSTFGLDVSPRDYLGKVSAWYFGWST